MTEPAPEPYVPQTSQAPVDPTSELARRTNLFGLALLGVALLLFAGTVGVALVYLALD